MNFGTVIRWLGWSAVITNVPVMFASLHANDADWLFRFALMIGGGFSVMNGRDLENDIHDRFRRECVVALRRRFQDRSEWAQYFP